MDDIKPNLFITIKRRLNYFEYIHDYYFCNIFCCSITYYNGIIFDE